MFLGYLKNGFEDCLDQIEKSNVLFDLELLKKTYQAYPQYCFAAYQNSQIIGVISAYAFDTHLYINVLNVVDDGKDILKRLVALLLKNISGENVLILIEEKFAKELEELSFVTYCDMYRFMHSGQAVAFNFSNSTAKHVSGEHYDEVSRKLDKKAFYSNRETYLKQDCVFSNSLKLSTDYGFLHSYVVNKRYIKISPWIMANEAFLDAEKLLRGVLYYRGLKKIFGFAPKNEKEIVDLYQSYKFEITGILNLCT